MERQTEDDLVDLGAASVETRGSLMGDYEPGGRFFTGLVED